MNDQLSCCIPSVDRKPIRRIDILQSMTPEALALFIEKVADCCRSTEHDWSTCEEVACPLRNAPGDLCDHEAIAKWLEEEVNDEHAMD